MNNLVRRAKAGKTLYRMTMQTCSLLAMSVCTASLWAQTDTPPMIPDTDSTTGAILDDSSASWSLTDLRLHDITLYWDNDGTVPNIVDDTDRYYTNGNGIELSFDPNFTDEISQRLAPVDQWENPRFGIGVAIKQRIFTGEDITDPNPPVTDHPYSGYLYLALSLQRADDHKHDHFELDIGIIGERAQSEAIQRFIHHTFPDENDPQGWSTQLANELTVNMSYDRTWRTRRGQIKGFGFEMLPAIGFDLGTVSVRARGKMTMRAGVNLPDDFGPATLLGHKDHTVDAAAWGEGDWSIYVYTAGGIDAVAHSIFLDGNTFAQSRSVDSERFVSRVSFGAVARYKALYVGWSQTLETETFEGQPDRQAWGALMMGYSTTF